jgi:hypothetical protein
MGDANLGSTAIRKLRDQETAGRKIRASSQFQEIAEQAEAIPLRSKTQYPIYVEARTLFLLRGIAKVEDMSVQDVIRQALDEGIERRIRRKPKKKRGKTARSS